MSPRLIKPSPVVHLAAAGLLALVLAACARTPPEIVADPVPPPRRPLDAKTQLEYGDPAPVRPYR